MDREGRCVDKVEQVMPPKCDNGQGLQTSLMVALIVVPVVSAQGMERAPTPQSAEPAVSSSIVGDLAVIVDSDGQALIKRTAGQPWNHHL